MSRCTAWTCITRCCDTVGAFRQWERPRQYHRRMTGRSGRGLLIAATATTLICAAMYAVPQHWHRGDPTQLSLTAWDRAVPFWPITGVLYFGAFLFLLLTFIALWPQRLQARRFLNACLLAQTVGMLCFLLWPTAYPRDLYPLPASTSPLGAALVNWCRSNDQAVN